MATSDSGDSKGPVGKDKPGDEKEQARNLVDRDKPREASGAGKQVGDDQGVFRPDENVDNQKSGEKGESTKTGHNTSIDTAPISGGKQLKGSEKAREDNIREESKKAESPRRDG